MKGLLVGFLGLSIGILLGNSFSIYEFSLYENLDTRYENIKLTDAYHKTGIVRSIDTQKSILTLEAITDPLISKGFTKVHQLHFNKETLIQVKYIYISNILNFDERIQYFDTLLDVPNKASDIHEGQLVEVFLDKSKKDTFEVTNIMLIKTNYDENKLL